MRARAAARSALERAGADRARARAGDRIGAASGAPLGFSAVNVMHLEEARPRPGRRVAVGTFDGVHLGHREVIAGSDSVLTFDPHPVAVVAPQHTPKLLTTLERKAELIGALGVADLIVIPDRKSTRLNSNHEW